MLFSGGLSDPSVDSCFLNKQSCPAQHRNKPHIFDQRKGYRVVLLLGARICRNNNINKEDGSD